MFDALDQVRGDAFRRMAEGARCRKSALHTPVVGTGAGDMRVMVLRAFDPAEGILRFHTDARSPKVAQIGEDAGRGGAMGVLFYDAAAKIQLRTKGLGWIERHGPIADQAWAASTNFARRCYLAQAAPGALAAGPLSGLPEEVAGIEPSDAQLLPARANFAVLLFKLRAIDWLYLAHDGHRRAQFSCDSAGQWQGRWAMP